MAVYDQGYRRYQGALTPRRLRFLVPARYAGAEVFSSKLVTAIFAVSFVFPLGAAVVIYLHHNVSAMEILQSATQALMRAFPIDARFFYYLAWAQGIIAFLLTGLVAPGLVAPDLAHNALPLYLCRPFTRTEYVLGKLTVLAGMLSAITWVPGLLLLALQTQLEGLGWLAEHARLVPAVFFGAWLWILVLALLGLALSAWVKWRTVAAGLLFAVIFITPAFALAVNTLYSTRWGWLADPHSLTVVLWEQLYYGKAPGDNVPVWAAALALAALAGLCLLLLRARIRAYEVVR